MVLCSAFSLHGDDIVVQLNTSIFKSIVMSFDHFLIRKKNEMTILNLSDKIDSRRLETKYGFSRKFSQIYWYCTDLSPGYMKEIKKLKTKELISCWITLTCSLSSSPDNWSCRCRGMDSFINYSAKVELS